MLAGQVKSISGRSAWAEFRDGFELEIRYLTRTELENLHTRAAARGENWGEAPDLSELIAKEVILDWRGLSSSVLRKMVVMDSYPDVEVPYDADDAAELLRNAHRIEEWVLAIGTNLRYF